MGEEEKENEFEGSKEKGKENGKENGKGDNFNSLARKDLSNEFVDTNVAEWIEDSETLEWRIPTPSPLEWRIRRDNNVKVILEKIKVGKEDRVETIGETEVTEVIEKRKKINSEVGKKETPYGAKANDDIS